MVCKARCKDFAKETVWKPKKSISCCSKRRVHWCARKKCDIRILGLDLSIPLVIESDAKILFGIAAEYKEDWKIIVTLIFPGSISM